MVSNIILIGDIFSCRGGLDDVEIADAHAPPILGFFLTERSILLLPSSTTTQSLSSMAFSSLDSWPQSLHRLPSRRVPHLQRWWRSSVASASISSTSARLLPVAHLLAAPHRVFVCHRWQGWWRHRRCFDMGMEHLLKIEILRSIPIVLCMMQSGEWIPLLLDIA
jgi:hypothetical protein